MIHNESKCNDFKETLEHEQICEDLTNYFVPFVDRIVCVFIIYVRLKCELYG